MSDFFLLKFKTYFLCFLFLFSCVTQKKVVDKNTAFQNLEIPYSSSVLKGSNTEFRNWWNVLHYDLILYPNYEQKFISGSVTIQFEIVEQHNNSIIQIDLQNPMQVTEIVEVNYESNKSNHIQVENTIDSAYYFRKGDAYFIDLNGLKNKNKTIALEIYFEGNPKIAKNAPWDGGWIFTQDLKGRPWMSAAVQGLGASAWFPNKDYWGDEPDNGMKFSIFVPQELVAVANGKLWESSFTKAENGQNIYTWEVTNSINTYNIIPYIGYYKNIKDEFEGKDGKLDIDYWVLDYNVEKAKKHFQQVKPMLTAFEDWMGAYPFYEDGYKLVESPYLGMEHQSNIAYGNGYQNGYLGSDLSATGWGKKFDFIIIHETGHEWFGNSITANDVADMWIHEAFTTYSEVMYVENLYGKDAANAYVQGIRKNILNDRPMVGKYGENLEGSGDMYFKGANMIHTLRQLMQDDVQFKKMIGTITQKFKHQTVSGATIENFLANFSGLDLKLFFDQYLRTIQIPTFETKEENGKTYFRWANVVDGFAMPLQLQNQQWIYPTTQWQQTELKDIQPNPNFLIQIK